MKQYAKLPAPRDVEAYDLKQGIEVEPEFGALLYALVRLNKPKVCVETGTYIGDSAEWIGKALRDNNQGLLITCDTDPGLVAQARSRLRELPIDVRQQDGKELLAECGIMDFVHIDGGEPSLRLEQLLTLGDHNIAPGGLVTWHDAVLWCPEMYEEFAALHDWPHLVLPTPVGVCIFQRPE